MEHWWSRHWAISGWCGLSRGTYRCWRRYIRKGRSTSWPINLHKCWWEIDPPHYTKATAVPTSSEELTICFCWRLKESTLIPLKVEFYRISILSTDSNVYICQVKVVRWYWWGWGGDMQEASWPIAAWVGLWWNTAYWVKCSPCKYIYQIAVFILVILTLKTIRSCEESHH